MRLFIAINFDRATIRSIRIVQSRLKQLGNGNFSKAENLHLTLAFLGEIEASRLQDIQQAMNEIECASMCLTFDHIGCFRRDDGDIWWIGLEENPALAMLQSRLSSNLRACEFSLENRKFSPHITLSRRTKLFKEPDRESIMGTPFSTQVSAISLMQSERIDGRLTYSGLYQKTL